MKKLLDRTKGDYFSAVEKLISAERMDFETKNQTRGCILTLSLEDSFEIHHTNNYNNKGLDNVLFVGYGEGYYTEVHKFVDSKYDEAKKSDNKLIELFTNALNLSKEINKRTEEHKIGVIIKGFGLMRINKKGFEELAFRED